MNEFSESDFEREKSIRMSSIAQAMLADSQNKNSAPDYYWELHAEFMRVSKSEYTPTQNLSADAMLKAANEALKGVNLTP